MENDSPLNKAKLIFSCIDLGLHTTAKALLLELSETRFSCLTYFLKSELDLP